MINRYIDIPLQCVITNKRICPNVKSGTYTSQHKRSLTQKYGGKELDISPQIIISHAEERTQVAHFTLIAFEPNSIFKSDSCVVSKK